MQLGVVLALQDIMDVIFLGTSLVVPLYRINPFKFGGVLFHVTHCFSAQPLVPRTSVFLRFDTTVVFACSWYFWSTESINFEWQRQPHTSPKPGYQVTCFKQGPITPLIEVK